MMPIPNHFSNPVGAVLAALATAYRHNLVSYAMVPEECHPPRFVVGFGTAAEIRAFETAVHQLADLPAGPELFPTLGEVAWWSAHYHGRLSHLDIVQALIGTITAELFEITEDHGTVRVRQEHPNARHKLVVIAALAIAGILDLDRRSAPAEAGEAVNHVNGASAAGEAQAAPVPTLDTAITAMVAGGITLQAAACGEG